MVKEDKECPRVLAEQYLALSIEAEDARKVMVCYTQKWEKLDRRIDDLRRQLGTFVGRNVQRRVFKLGNKIILMEWHGSIPPTIEVLNWE